MQAPPPPPPLHRLSAPFQSRPTITGPIMPPQKGSHHAHSGASLRFIIDAGLPLGERRAGPPTVARLGLPWAGARRGASRKRETKGNKDAETNLEKRRQENIHSQTHKYLSIRVREIGWCGSSCGKEGTPGSPSCHLWQICWWQLPLGTVILRRLGTGVGDRGRVLLKEVPGILHLAAVWPGQVQTEHSINSE